MTDRLDCRGMKCPQPILKIAIKAGSIAPGTTLEVLADCPSFPAEVAKWCTDRGKVLISCVDHGGYNMATIQF